MTYPTAIKYGRPSITTPTPIVFPYWLYKLVHGFQFTSVRIRFAVPLGSKDTGIEPTESSSSTGATINLGDGYSLSTSESLTRDSLSYKSLVSAGICRVGRLKEVGLGIQSKLEFVAAQSQNSSVKTRSSSKRK